MKIDPKSPRPASVSGTTAVPSRNCSLLDRERKPSAYLDSSKRPSSSSMWDSESLSGSEECLDVLARDLDTGAGDEASEFRSEMELESDPEFDALVNGDDGGDADASAATQSLTMSLITADDADNATEMERDDEMDVQRQQLDPVDTTEKILNYALDVKFGLDHASSGRLSACRSAVDNFLSDLEWAVTDDALTASFCAPTDGADGNEQTSWSKGSTSSGTPSSGSFSSTPNQPSGAVPPQRTGKRKSSRKKDEDGDEEDEEDDARRVGSIGTAAKKARTEPPIRMSCPYRKKNPLRFNVRDHRLCATTAFTEMAELRYVQWVTEKNAPFTKNANFRVFHHVSQFQPRRKKWIEHRQNRFSKRMEYILRLVEETALLHTILQEKKPAISPIWSKLVANT
jgi:hypothetical protein